MTLKYLFFFFLFLVFLFFFNLQKNSFYFMIFWAVWPFKRPTFGLIPDSCSGPWSSYSQPTWTCLLPYRPSWKHFQRSLPWLVYWEGLSSVPLPLCISGSVRHSDSNRKYIISLFDKEDNVCKGKAFSLNVRGSLCISFNVWRLAAP